MEKYIRLSLLSILLAVMNLVQAQEPKYEVVGFERTSPKDQTAELNPMKDNFGKDCAVFRVVTEDISPELQKGFYFECDKDVKRKDVMKRVQKNDEIWVWVSPGIKQFEIKHDVLGDFVLYIMADYDATVEPLDTWKVTLVASDQSSSTTVSNSNSGLQQQYLGFDINPADADYSLFVDGEQWHETRKLVNCGKHSFRIEAVGYKLYEGEEVVGSTPIYIFVPLEAVEGQPLPKPAKKPVEETQVVQPKQVVEPQTKDESIIEQDDMNVEPDQTTTEEVGKKNEIKSQSFLIANGVYVPQSYSSINRSYWAAGLSFGGVKRLGWFISLMTNGSVEGFTSDGTCDAWGYTSYGEQPAFTGEVVMDRWSAMFGGVVRIAKPLYFRLGAGYGVRNVSWKAKFGKTYLNKDLSIRGMDAAAGLQLHLGGFIISAEAVTTTDFSRFGVVEPRVGLGFAF